MKKALKKLLGTLLTLAMLTTLLNVTVFAAAPAYSYLDVGKATYTDLSVGSEVQIPVSLANLGTGQYLSGFSFTLKNTEYLTVKSVAFADALSSWSDHSEAVTDGKYYEKLNSTFSEDPTTSLYSNGLLFTVTYTIAKAIPETTAVNPSITGLILKQTSQIYLNSANGASPSATEKANSVVYPDNGSIYLEKTPPASVDYTVTVAATPAAVYMDETVTVTVKVTGGQFTGALYTLKYDTDKFTLVTKPDDAELDGTSTDTYKHVYLGYNSPDGKIIATYTFKALPQDTEVTGYFELGEYATVCSSTDALSGSDEPATISDAAPVTIKLIPAGSTDPEGLTVSADDVEKEYDGNAYGVTATANKTGATIRYRDTSGNYTLTESPKYKDVGEYTVYFKATLKGYADATGSAKVKITEPAYYTESVEYVAGHSLVLVYTNTDGLNFKYDNRTMYDVTNAGYSLSGTAYKHVYGIVVSGTSDMTKLSYATGTATMVGYSTNVNGDSENKTDVKDAVCVVSVYNADPTYMTDANMMVVLRADVNHDKKVDNSDTNMVLKAM